MTVSRRGFLKGLAALLVSAPLIKVPAQTPSAPALPLAPAPVRIAEQVEEEELAQEIRAYEPYIEPPEELYELPGELPEPLRLGRLVEITYTPWNGDFRGYGPRERIKRVPQDVTLTWLLSTSCSDKEDTLGRFLEAYHGGQLANFDCHMGCRHFYIIGHVFGWSLLSPGTQTASELKTQVTCERIIEEEIL